jgi:hypothetical protein
MVKTVKIGPTLSQILLSVVDKIARLEGDICAYILSNPQQLGPKVGNIKEEVTSATTCNSRIVKSFPGQARFSIGK